MSRGTRDLIRYVLQAVAAALVAVAIATAQSDTFDIRELDGTACGTGPGTLPGPDHRPWLEVSEARTGQPFAMQFTLHTDARVAVVVISGGPISFPGRPVDRCTLFIEPIRALGVPSQYVRRGTFGSTRELRRIVIAPPPIPPGFPVLVQVWGFGPVVASSVYEVTL